MKISFKALNRRITTEKEKTLPFTQSFHFKLCWLTQKIDEIVSLMSYLYILSILYFMIYNSSFQFIWMVLCARKNNYNMICIFARMLWFFCLRNWINYHSKLNKVISYKDCISKIHISPENKSIEFQSGLIS